ncbi:follicle-stimulating hormone receptor precursor [Cynoglossus semilaevis]|uniref:Thyrotropin receptor n=1 Tax=Cynoglossus semilaevis TaxID=244447 RepID=B2ZGP6_CYNSE|nr:follicle-stimulating hormone receptor precursor [Cynoglossus semilaevis]ACD39387.2 follicle-stimulating hormone receptor [Cynoglossus semilaevis]
MWTANMTTVVTSCLALLLTMFGVNMTAASAPDTNAGDEATIGKQSLLSSNHLSFGVTEILFNISSSTEYLRVQHTQVTVIRQSVLSHLQLLTTLIILENNRLETIGPFAFANFPKLSEIIISGNVALEDIGAFAFSNLPELTDIIITKSRNLRCIHPDAFRNLIKLKYLSISNTGLNSFPDFTKIYSTASGFLFDLHDNSHIMRIPANAFRGLCTQTIREILLTRNGIKEVASDAFNGTKILRLYLRGNKQLTHIHPKAFVGSSGLTELDVSETAISSLPNSILGELQKLIAESSYDFKKLPHPEILPKLRQANLTYPSHCCAFKNIHRNRSRWNSLCSHPKARDDVHFYRDHCSNSTSITCSPLPDEFNPCEDIMSATFLQILIWVISVLTLLGNGVVLLVLLGSRAKLTVPRFLMCHLAFADLCMGVYLVVIATVDVLTRGRYYDYAIDWQRGLGCSAAGFFTVFASELSVFTLTAITLERWHTITYALRLDRKIRLRHACIIMAAGWTFSLITAFLPTVGVSSYSKVSICLPMDVESVESQVYVVSLLLLNILAFFVVCSCYLSIYLTVHNPLSMPAHADTRVAQRMAILIFTDFICMAPISFFAISAALKLPLITVSESKLLLVLFYPINSCSNPFLYAFFTRTFRQDFFILSARFGMFKTRAQIYRTESSSCQQPAWISPKSSHVVLYSLANALSLDAK